MLDALDRPAAASVALVICEGIFDSGNSFSSLNQAKDYMTMINEIRKEGVLGASDVVLSSNIRMN